MARGRAVGGSDREAEMRKLKKELRAIRRTERKVLKGGGSGMGTVALVLGGLLLLAGLAWGASSLRSLVSDDNCPGHEHAAFRVFDQGEELSFQHPRFDMSSGMPMRAHLHQSNDWQIHLEGGCATMAQFFNIMGMKLTSESLRLDEELHEGRVLKSEGDLTLRFFIKRVNETWAEMPNLPGYQARDYERILITYGNETDVEIAAQQARVPIVEGTPPDAPDTTGNATGNETTRQDSDLLAAFKPGLERSPDAGETWRRAVKQGER